MAAEGDVARLAPRLPVVGSAEVAWPGLSARHFGPASAPLAERPDANRSHFDFQRERAHRRELQRVLLLHAGGVACQPRLNRPVPRQNTVCSEITQVSAETFAQPIDLATCNPARHLAKL